LPLAVAEKARFSERELFISLQAEELTAHLHGA